MDYKIYFGMRISEMHININPITKTERINIQISLIVFGFVNSGFEGNPCSLTKPGILRMFQHHYEKQPKSA